MDYPIIKDKVTGCWLWAAKLTADGYGITPQGTAAHRHVWKKEEGPIPKGLFLDHICRRRNCVNPMHLEPVNQSENELRKSWRRRSRATKCKMGHDIRVNFLLTRAGGKLCRRCQTPDRLRHLRAGV